jgi:low affinity Fe/Cu permease
MATTPTGSAHPLFTRFAKWTAKKAGRPLTFGTAVTLIVVWAATGPLFHYSDTWQLVINTSTTIITFLMVFLIQNTQNRDGEAIQVKLDELIRAVEGAHNTLINLEDMEEDELDRLHAHYGALAEHARAHAAKRRRAREQAQGAAPTASKGASEPTPTAG